MSENYTENIISKVNGSTFLKEFTFSTTQFNRGESGQTKELADNIVWIDDIVLLFQMKERSNNAVNTSSTLIKWFNNKIMRKAVSQMKDTLKFIEESENLEIENDFGHKIDLSKIAGKVAKKIILYNPNCKLVGNERLIKFHKSKTAGLIHILHIEDYIELTKYLITPAEIEEYLTFREELYEYHRDNLNNYSENVVLGHFVGEDKLDELDNHQEENIQKLLDDKTDFDFMSILSDFSNRKVPILGNGETDHYYIIKELAKLKRKEIAEVKKRFIWAFEACKTEIVEIPSRIIIPRTEMGYIFIPVNKSIRDHWENGLFSFTNLHLYEQKLDKCIGVAIFENKKEKGMIEVMWCSIEREWKYDSILDGIIKEKSPFPPMKIKNLKRY